MKRIGDPKRVGNEEIIKKMKNGEDLATCNLQDTWFPPRPIIKKDKTALGFLPKKKGNK